MFIAEPPNIYWYDVREPYFNAYRDCMDPVYKDPLGRICEYTEMKKKTIYKQPFYRENMRERI